MSITKESEWEGMRKVSEAVAETLRAMRAYAQPGMSTAALDVYGSQVLASYGAKSAPKETYQFPGFTCISVNEVMAHGVPSASVILKEGDLINIDVSAELDGYWADNGGSFVLGEDLHGHQALVDASREILQQVLNQIQVGMRIAHVGKFIHQEARHRGYRVIKNLAGHGVGRSLHEEPEDILNYYNRFNRERFKKNSVVAIETFISTRSNYAETGSDGWTLTGDRGGFVAQHEQTLVVTDHAPIILTEKNDIWK